jgi:hypothetical protein
VNVKRESRWKNEKDLTVVVVVVVVVGERRSIILLEGSQALPVRPSDKNSVNAKASHLHVTTDLRCERQRSDSAH